MDMSTVQLTGKQVSLMAGVSAGVVKKAIESGELKAETVLSKGAGKRSRFRITMPDAREWIRTQKKSRAKTNGSTPHADLITDPIPLAQLAPAPDPDPAKIQGGGGLLTLKALREQTELLRQIRDLLQQVLR